MNKKIIGVGVGIALLISPLLASAQATDSSNASVIASLTSLIATLSQELQQLLAARTPGSQSQNTPSGINLTTSVTSGTAPLTVTFSMADYAGSMIYYGDGSSDCTATMGMQDPTACKLSGTTPFTHTYSAPGTYRVTASARGVDREMSATIIVTGAGATSNGTQACSSYLYLQKGATDTTTGGAVSQLQQFLGMPNVTGYYGAQTAIAFQNKCGNLGNAQPTSVAGMSKYTDSNFGFSFWYPSTWTVSKQADNSVGSWLTLSDSSGQKMIINEDLASNGVFADDNCNAGSGDRRIYFDTQAGVWMTGSIVADISQNTMGGLHMLHPMCNNGGAFDQVVPLSANAAVDVHQASALDVRPLANTIVATNVAVAIPVSTAQQTATIQAEASAYGAQQTNTVSQSSLLQTYTNSQYGFSVQYPSTLTVNPTCSNDNSPESCSSQKLISFYAADSNSINGFANGYVVVSQPSVVGRCMSDPGNGIGTYSTKTINGITFGVYGIGSAAAGTQEAITTYSTQRNGLCYSITEDEYSHYSGGTYGNSQAKTDLESIVQSFRFTQ